MSKDPSEPGRFSLRRWSQRKHAARSADALRDPTEHTRHETAQRSKPGDVEVPVRGGAPAAARVADDAAASAIAGVQPGPHLPEAALPPIDSLTIDSDYTAFMRPGVDAGVKRDALKRLFSDPRFNVMDGLDVYIDDYSKPDPIDPAIVRTLVQARYIFDPPATRVTAEGFIEDVPPGEPAAGALAAEPTTVPELEVADHAALPETPQSVVVAVERAVDATVAEARGRPAAPDSDSRSTTVDDDRSCATKGHAEPGIEPAGAAQRREPQA